MALALRGGVAVRKEPICLPNAFKRTLQKHVIVERQDEVIWLEASGELKIQFRDVLWLRCSLCEYFSYKGLDQYLCFVAVSAPRVAPAQTQKEFDIKKAEEFFKVNLIDRKIDPVTFAAERLVGSQVVVKLAGTAVEETCPIPYFVPKIGTQRESCGLRESRTEKDDSIASCLVHVRNTPIIAGPISGIASRSRNEYRTNRYRIAKSNNDANVYVIIKPCLTFVSTSIPPGGVPSRSGCVR